MGLKSAILSILPVRLEIGTVYDHAYTLQLGE